MSKLVYTLKKRKDTDELHLFEASQKADAKDCTPQKESICGKMNKSESEANVFACQTEEAARIQAASQGRKVCGICISHLYATY
jgi:hypothetical protein